MDWGAEFTDSDNAFSRLEGTLVVLLVEDVHSVDEKARFSANPLVLEESVFRSENATG